MDEFESLRTKLLTIKEQLIKAINQSEEPATNESSISKKERCWDGYEPTPGKQAYSKGSCRPLNKEEEMLMCDNGQWEIKKLNPSSKRQ